MTEQLRRTISFDEANHTYKDEYNKYYTSVTTVIGQYHEAFNTEYWAAYKAKELNTTAEALKREWEKGRNEACDKGNRIHKELEDSINETTGKQKFEFDLTDEIRDNLAKKGFKIMINRANLEVLASTPLARKYPKIYAYLRNKILDGWCMFAEKRIYWADFLIAGTIDCLLVKGMDFIIVDWKTNKDQLKFEAGYYKKDPITKQKTNIWVPKKSYFFPPINTIEYCKGNVYTLQLSLYAYLMEMWGFRCVDLVLFHIRENQEPREYKIIYVNLACKLLTSHFKTRSNINSNSKFNHTGLDDLTIT